MKKSGVCTFAVLASVTSVATGCSSDSESIASTALNKVMPSIAITSPTTSQSARLSFLKHKNSLFDSLSDLFKIQSVIAATDSADQGTISQQLASNKATLSKSPSEGANSINLSFNSAGYANCYGPSLTYAGTSYPGGDLGLFSAVEPPGTGTQACAAAEMNKLALGMDPFNQVAKAVGVILAQGNSNGTSLPGVGESVSISSVPNMGGATVTSATLSRLQDDGGYPVYKVVILLSLSGNTGSVQVQHSPLNDENTKNRGNIQVVLPTNGGLYLGASMNYVNDGTYLTYLASLANNQTSANTDFFTSGMVDFSKAAFGQNGYMMLAKFNTSTNEGIMRFAWSAGKNDAAARVFEAQTTSNGSVLTGIAYFGFSAGKLNALTPSTSEWITRFYTDWLGQSTPLAGKMQGQTFSQSTAGGEFANTGFYGPFVPTASGTGSGTITGNTYFNGSVNVGSVTFVTSGALGTISDVSVPSFAVQ